MTAINVRHRGLRSGKLSFSNSGVLDVTAEGVRLWRNFVKEDEIIEKGFVTVPDRPGIGVEMNEEAARSAQIPGTPWFASGEGA